MNGAGTRASTPPARSGPDRRPVTRPRHAGAGRGRALPAP